MRRGINHWLERLTGYRLQRSGQFRLARYEISDPRMASYHDPGTNAGCLIFAPVGLGLGFNAFTLGPESAHPWVAAVRASDGGRDDRAFVATLEAYYELVRPGSVIEWLDIPHGLCPLMEALPLYAWSVLPWSTGKPEGMLREIETATLEENRRHGLDEGMSAGAKAFGPMSAAKLRVEAARISGLFASLRRTGLDYRRGDYNLRATFLICDSQWSWLSMGGMHRVAMAAAANVQEIPVRVASVVRREEVDVWPQVVSGLYTRDAALTVFDRLINRRPPACTQAWLDWLNASQLDL